ncbi:hypothetical protein D0T49_08580 [Paludibacter sp. 221]|uniref:Ig-like domain-containing domain n=1 Tax=Paludibacter sp. 221 TaxID=2302939 RepID=UPI0013D54384|nr:Ig-like domain-containing domain [Paludibacter sp. 221]NDV47099.1 hypothetical protein [Paludibacter sp. 221]
MKNKIDIGHFIVILLIMSFVYSCANRGSGPTGGPKDETPPKVTKSNPVNGSLNFAKKEIQVEFDENISLDKLTENVVISPPQQRNPDIRAQGKRLIVRFDEELKENTTYTVNFGNAIVDLNEKNPLENYRFAFSTGSKIDTLSISGFLVNAEDLNPASGIIVGIYAEHDDSVFTKKPFLRIGKTDEMGYFVIDNIKEGTYRIFALGDNNRDYYFQTGEGLAMYDSLITPTFEMVEHRDTIWADSLTIDTIHIHRHAHFYPNDIVLRYFKENKVRQYFIKSERTQPEKFTLYFNTTLAELPKIEPLNFEWEDKYILQRNNTLDTLSYWLTDSITWKTDTLRMAMTYFKTDSIFQLEQTTDTINVVTRKTNARARTTRKNNEKDKKQALSFKTNIKPTFEVYDPIIIQVSEPLIDYDISKIKLNEKVDTILKPLVYEWQQIDSTKMIFSMSYKWEPEKSYTLEIDSAAFTSIYNKSNDENKSPFKVRSLDEYSEIKIVLTDYDSRAVIQILDAKDKVVRTKNAESGGTLFQHLKPTDYYVRMFIDENGNGKWDTGEFSTRRQPEEVYYYPHKLTLKANFEFTEIWNHKEMPLLEQKPLEILQDVSKKKK